MLPEGVRRIARAALEVLGEARLRAEGLAAAMRSACARSFSQIARAATSTSSTRRARRRARRRRRRRRRPRRRPGARRSARPRARPAPAASRRVGAGRSRAVAEDRQPDLDAARAYRGGGPRRRRRRHRPARASSTVRSPMHASSCGRRCRRRARLPPLRARAPRGRRRRCRSAAPAARARRRATPGTTGAMPAGAARSGTPQRRHASATSGVERSANASIMRARRQDDRHAPRCRREWRAPRRAYVRRDP